MIEKSVERNHVLEVDNDWIINSGSFTEKFILFSFLINTQLFFSRVISGLRKNLPIIVP